MKEYNRVWRSFFAIGIIAIAIHQLICKDLRPVILPPSFPAWVPQRLVVTWIFSLYFIVAGALILFEINARKSSLLLAFILLLLVLFCQMPYELALYPANLGVWTNPLKELTLSGGAFIIAGFLKKENYSSKFFQLLEKLIPLGKYFLAITMLLFGIDHFIYTDFVKTLIPTWIPGAIFWTYFAGIALILSGVAIVINIQRKLASALLGVMIFLWLLILHIPRAIADPHSGNGNEWTSVFEALAFSGIAFLTATETNKFRQNK